MSLLWLPKWDLIYETLILPEIILMKNIHMRRRHVILLPVISCKGWSNFLLYLWSSLQKQPPEVFYTKGVLRNFQKIHRKTLMPEPLCQWTCRPKAYNFIKKRLWQRCFPVKFAKFLRTPFVQNTYGCWFWVSLSCMNQDDSQSVKISLAQLHLNWIIDKTKEEYKFHENCKIIDTEAAVQRSS